MSAKILGIDVGSIKICAAVAELGVGGKVSIIAVGSAESRGIRKGAVSNIELVAKDIKAAVEDALRTAGTNYDKVVVSLSGREIKSFNCDAFINMPEKEVNITQMERLMQAVSSRARVDYDDEVVHVLPYNFKLDEQDSIENPLGMSGSRLEAQAQFIAAPKSAVTNLRRAVEKAGYKIDNIVLSGYASAISTLSRDEKELGVALIDMGGATCSLVVYIGNSVRYSGYLPLGSASITNDLAGTLNTTQEKAEEIKLKLSSLKQDGVKTIPLPLTGDENEVREASVDQILSIVHARVTETLSFLASMLSESGYEKLIQAGVVLTGGMTKLDSSIKDLASAYFHKPVRLARPNDLEGLDARYKDPSYSCAIGLCLYGAGRFTPYEIDSQKRMRYKGEKIFTSKEERVENNVVNNNIFNSGILSSNNPQNTRIPSGNSSLRIDKSSDFSFEEKKPISWFRKILNWIKNLF